MKFVFFGYDTMMPSLLRLVSDGHELCGVFSFKAEIDASAAVREFCEKMDVEVFLEKPTRGKIDALEADGVGAFVVAGYPWKVPVPKKAIGVNFHPSLLPYGRGIMPLPEIILNAPHAAGATLHVLEAGFDTGAIISQKHFELERGENVDTLGARCVMAAPDMLSDFMRSPFEAIASATPQDESKASTFALPSQEMRAIDWLSPPQETLNKINAFGRFGALCKLGEDIFIVKAGAFWAQKHNFQIASVVHKIDDDFIVAVKGGFIHLKTPEKLVAEDSK